MHPMGQQILPVSIIMDKLHKLTTDITDWDNYFMWSHVRWVHVCLAVNSHMHFWQNDWGFLCATVVMWEWNEYWNKSQPRKTEKVDPRKEYSLTTPAMTQTSDLLITSPAL